MKKGFELVKIEDNFESVYVCGDINGEFDVLIGNVEHYGIENAVILVAGDCGIGFEKRDYYNHLYADIKGLLEQQNIQILLVRGNHDDPAYFIDKLIDYPLLKTLPDYTVVQFQETNILCIGGAVSVDRQMRLWRMATDLAGEKIYWGDESVVFDEDILNNITAQYNIDVVITHTCPTFCHPINKIGFDSCLARGDSTLNEDIRNEREAMDKIYETLISKDNIIQKWFYGHFHQSRTEVINAVSFTLLDIHEMKLVIDNTNP